MCVDWRVSIRKACSALRFRATGKVVQVSGRNNPSWIDDGGIHCVDEVPDKFNAFILTDERVWVFEIGF